MNKNIKKMIFIILFITSTIYTFYDKFIDSRLNIYKNNMSVHYIYVGQGDSTLVIAPNKKTVLIDSGDNEHGMRVVSYIKKLGISKLDVVIATHPDSDHIGGMDKVIKNFDIGTFAMPDVVAETNQYKQMMVELKNKKINTKPLYTYDEINLDENIEYEILSPEKGKTYQDRNEYSIVSKITYKNTSFMIMGDATIENEMSIINNVPNIDIDVLKVGHHGSSTSTSEYFLKKTTPSVAIISCGKNNKYHHPHKIVLDLLEKYKILYYRTDLQGDIVLVSDGNKVKSNI